jgi:ABC-type uncharacterized transport system fused permease/ATPase subunit
VSEAPFAHQPGTTWRGTLRHFLAIAGGFWTGEQRRGACGLALGLLVLNGAEVSLLLRLNSWNRDLFNALQLRDGHGVLVQCGVLLLLVACFASVSCLHLQARRWLALGWRAWLAHRLTAAWLRTPGRATANTDGRIAEDARIATEEAVELACSFSHGLITLTCFVGVLWALSAQGPVVFGGVRFDVPGYLLWIAILTAGLAMAGAGLLGRPLVRATDHRQAQEAEYRAALVTGPATGPVLPELFGAVAAAFNRQSRAFAHLQLFCVGNTRLGAGIPIIAATPAWLAGSVTLGWVMQAAQAFQEVAGALGWPVDHMPRLATWRASAERVIALYEACSLTEAPATEAIPGTAAEAPAAA